MRRSYEELPLTLREAEAEKEAAAAYRPLGKADIGRCKQRKRARRTRIETVPLTDAEREAEAACELHTFGMKLPF